MSTLGVKGHDGCHFSYEGYLEFAARIYPLVSRDFYGEKFDKTITPPKLLTAGYSSNEEITLTFDQPIEIEDKRAVNGNIYWLKDHFFFKTEMKGDFAPVSIKSMTVKENLVTLKTKLCTTVMFRFKPEPENRDQPRIAPRLRPVKSEDEEQAQTPLFWWIVLLLGAGFLIYQLTSGDKGSPTVFNEDGEEVLSPERQAKLDKELEEIDNAVQYVLLATADGYYPCYTCPDGSGIIFLYKFEVWRYGTTRKGEDGRYPNGDFGAANVMFLEQFEGTYSECLKIEKVKIYNYPLLPEAKKRDFKLFRPPGNKNDS